MTQTLTTNGFSVTIPEYADKADIVAAFTNYHLGLSGYLATFPPISAGSIAVNLTGNVLGNLTGNVSGNLTGNVTGNLTGTASNATAVVHYKAATGGDYSATTPTNKIFTGPTQPTTGMTVGDIWMW